VGGFVAHGAPTAYATGDGDVPVGDAVAVDVVVDVAVAVDVVVDVAVVVLVAVEVDVRVDVFVGVLLGCDDIWYLTVRFGAFLAPPSTV
jgi:hypothetical protein